MASVFSTNFNYKGSDYTAMVCQIEGSITITFPDPTLHIILPEGKVVYNLQKGIEINPMQLAPAQDLISALVIALMPKGIHLSGR